VSFGRLVLAQHGVVELGLCDRDGQELLGLVGDRAAKLLRLHPGQVDQADDHSLVGDPEDHLPGVEPGPPPQPSDRGGDGRRVDHLAVHDRAGRQAGLPEALEHDPAATDRQFGRAHRRGADVETGHVSGHLVESPNAYPSSGRPTLAGDSCCRPADRSAPSRRWRPWK
jgi:hypothetical protein